METAQRSTPCDFYPRPPRGGRRVSASTSGAAALNFYPRPPRGGRRQLVELLLVHLAEFLSTPSARRATDDESLRKRVQEFLSTPSARRATLFGEQLGDDVVISIHALREEGDRHADIRFSLKLEFLSTPSARRATCPSGRCTQTPEISIHALREEGDL